MVKYSIFVSSVYKSLIDERKEVIDAVVKTGNFIISMENYTMTDYEQIKKLIEISDVFILLIGDQYGTGITEEEYKFAFKNNIPILPIILPQFTEMKKTNSKTGNAKKLINFYNSIKNNSNYPVEKEESYFEIISKFLNNIAVKSKLIGWERKENIQKWENDNSKMYFQGKWYTFHVNPATRSYLKIGELNIIQNFEKDKFTELEILGASNYFCKYDQNTGTLEYDISRGRTTWTADYEIYLKGAILIKIEGVFHATRDVTTTFKEVLIEEGRGSGIHEFNEIKFDSSGKPGYMIGRFENVGVNKTGYIALFRNREDRDNYLINNYWDRIEATSSIKKIPNKVTILRNNKKKGH